jgi:hypothetical protein
MLMLHSQTPMKWIAHLPQELNRTFTLVTN